MKAIIFGVLYMGFLGLFHEIRILDHMTELLKKTRWGMDVSARQRALECRKQLAEMRQENTLWAIMERSLCYSGMKTRFPELTAEIWIAGSIVITALVMVLFSALFGIVAGLVGAAVWVGMEYLLLQYLRAVNLRAVNEHMMKLLDFLGNYSITAGEVTSVFYQVSRYMEEPVKSVLEACYYEAQVTGDTSLALLSMAEKIEHPKFKELARNMEVSLRYCADFTMLVSGSRRSLREYLRMSQERKGMLREGLINMALLLALSLVVLFTVGYLVQMSAIQLLTTTLPGRVGMVVLAVIGVLFAGQMRRIHC